jgi:hypothetical protein
MFRRLWRKLCAWWSRRSPPGSDDPPEQMYPLW